MGTILDVARARDALARGAIAIDARAGAPRATLEANYLEGHLPGARRVDLDTDLAAPVIDAARGGRHPLPSPRAFASVLRRLGVRDGSSVVVYDDHGGANAAARLWWMLRAIGHEDVAVLDGGLSAWRDAGLALEAGPVADAEGPTPPERAFAWPTTPIEDVALHGATGRRLVLDVRDGARFRGEVEPIDPVAGRLPFAKNLPFATTNLTASKTFESPDVLRARYLAFLDGRPPSELVVHCGSGVTACHTLLALEHAGLSGASLYVGSFGEWCRRDELVVARG